MLRAYFSNLSAVPSTFTSSQRMFQEHQGGPNLRCLAIRTHGILKLGTVLAIKIINIIDKINDGFDGFLPVLLDTSAGPLPWVETVIAVAKPVKAYAGR